MNRKSFLSSYPEIKSGMHVYSKDKKSLGRIISLNEESFTVEQGVFFPKDFSFRYEEIENISEGNIYLSKTPSELREWKEESFTGWKQVEDINKGRLQAVPTEPFREKFESIREETIKIPLYEEELSTKKVGHKTGEIRIRKIVHTELKHVTVPIDHVETRIERVVGDRRALNEEDAQSVFQESTVSIPLMDENVEIEKHAVLKEEVQIKKEHKVEQCDLAQEVRTEDVEVFEEGKTPKKAG